MSKIKYLLFIFISFVFISGVKAESIDSIKMDVYIDNEGNAHVTEEWRAHPTEKTEYYHAYHGIGNSNIIDFQVRDEQQEYVEIAWDISASMSQKAYKFGIIEAEGGYELCWGKSSYKNHTYTLTYTITNFVSMTSDEKQMIYWNLLDSISPAPGNVEIIIHADTYFEDSVPVWGYGNYGGLAYVHDGKIYLSNDNLSSDEYMVVLAEFPSGTFQIDNMLDETLQDYKDMAETGATHYEEKENTIVEFFITIMTVIFPFIFVLIAILASKSSNHTGSYKLDFGQTGRKVSKDTPMFRDIPCNKDIFRAYWIAINYNLVKKETDFLGALILKWIKEKKVEIDTKESKVFKKENAVIIFKEGQEFSNDLEQKMYKFMLLASKDGILESKEFGNWCSNNYSKVLNWFDDVIDYQTECFMEEGKIQIVEKNSAFTTSKKYVVDSSMMEEAKQMYGLKEFFKEFENIQDKEAIEVKLFDEYLMYAQIFGVADKVAKQFKKLYPDVITNYDYDTIVYINYFSYHGISSASLARSRAQSYSSGGGGFSSGGGGFGSFGGGGGGSR